MYGLIRGPMVSIAFIVFVLGMIFQWIQFFKLTGKKVWVYPPGEIKSEKKTAGQWVAFCLSSLRGTLWKTDPLMMGVTWVFHVFLVGIPIFLLGHNILLDQSWRVSLWSLPEPVTDLFSLVVLACMVFFLGRRLFVTRVRVISTLYDYVVWLIAAVPFLTGYLAYHQWFDYDTVITLHILAGEVMLIAIPFTKLGHMLYFFLYRFLIGSEYSLARGARTW